MDTIAPLFTQPCGADWMTSMKTIPLKKGLFALLILEAAVISLVTIALMIRLFAIYTNLIYNESAEVLNLFAVITDTKLSDIENLSFEVLSNPDIQSNLRRYNDSPSQYEAYKATNDLYTQLFTRSIMNRNIVSISFVFPDGRRVDAGRLQRANLSGAKLEKIIDKAARADGSCGWMANMAGENTITLYRLIKDISGNNRFRTLGTLIVNIDGDYLLSHTPISQKYQPEIICIAGEEILAKNPQSIAIGALLDRINGTKNYDIARINREPYFISVKQLARNDWRLVYLLSNRELLSSVFNTNLVYIAALLLIVLAVTAIGYLYANAIGKPLTELTKAMKVVEERNYSVVLNNPIPEPRLAVAEVVQLSRDFSRMVGRIDHLIREVYMKQLLIAEMKYKMLQQQINPHFLYNTLDTINWKAMQGGNEDISVMVKSLSKLLRGSIKGPDIITVGEDINFVEDYIKIQKIRFEERLDFSMAIPDSALACLIPRLTLQPIVENCIIHNLEKYAGTCRICIGASISSDRLEICVDDTGRGVDLRHMEMVLSGRVETANTSIGLKNIDQRIKMAFGERFGICVENKEPTGTRVTVILPANGGD